MAQDRNEQGRAPVNPERWLQLKDIFGRALELDPAGRAVFLDHACRDDTELRREIENLLTSHDQADGFLAQPAGEAAAEWMSQDDAADPLIGSRLGPYVVNKKLGQGGMGIVYLATDTRLGRDVAVKALAPQYTSDRERRERLRREARIAATLSHPSIATVFALEEYDGSLYIVSEYVHGSTLHEELAAGPLPAPRLLDTAIEIAGALAAAHDRGIIHRDLKPENVVRKLDGKIKILDFGLARLLASHTASSQISARLTREGIFLGTPAYASPEQLLGHEVDFHSDIFSFGIILYELACGNHPFSATDSVATIARILEAEPHDMAQLRQAAPPGLESIVERCLRKIPEQRYGSAQELVGALEQVRRRIAAPAPPPKEETYVPDRPARSDPSRTLWWWQFHQAFIGFAYYGMLYPMWQVKVWHPRIWGPLLFFSFLGAVSVAANLRFYLWFASAFYPEELSETRLRVAPWIRLGDLVFVALLLSAALAIISAHEIIATLLIGVAIAVLGAFLIIEPTTTRAAFPGDSS
jgi:serine/threonine protein kinase